MKIAKRGAPHSLGLFAALLLAAAAGCGEKGKVGGEAEPQAVDEAPAPADDPASQSPAAPAAWSPSGYVLNGAEPFWGGEVNGTVVTYTTPENQAGETVQTVASYGAAQEVYEGTLDGSPFQLTLTPGPCSNGMSDHQFAYAATLLVKGETRSGCADAK